ncbi:hypothetical protein [Luteimonas sp. SDU82]|uniref:hypothetical protein n=1 Tax=Luteimonas sp. SDU82 TaxID=3422592 RepID=UPI003EBBC7B9
MARLTDTERGARMALDVATHWLHPDLFGLDPAFDEIAQGVFAAAAEQLAECRACRQAVAA